MAKHGARSNLPASAAGQFLPGDKMDEGRDEDAEMIASGRVRELTVGRKSLMGAGEEEPVAKPRAGAERIQDRQPRVLRQDGAEAAGRGADDHHRFVAEYPRDVVTRSRQPV